MAYPRVEDGMNATADDLEKKLVRIGAMKPRGISSNPQSYNRKSNLITGIC